MNNFFQLIENINNTSLFSILENFNSYYSILIIFILYHLISNSFMIIILIFIGIIIGFYIVYLLRDTIIPFLLRM
jgi:hypothetical protein